MAVQATLRQLDEGRWPSGNNRIISVKAAVEKGKELQVSQMRARAAPGSEPGYT
jgi:hypothetical protein